MGIGHERFENGGSILGRYPGRCYIGSQCSSTLPLGHLIVASYNTQTYGGRILLPPPKGGWRGGVVISGIRTWNLLEKTTEYLVFIY